MDNCIRVLSETVANQIAAGEVIQQPASAVKELVENAIDAGATSVDVVVKDAGKTLIQVIDNGKGMSPDDAVLCFERHATSKLRQAEDLMRISTMGFRGEALASIAAIAHVQLLTRRPEDELACQVHISGGKVESVESTVAAIGTSMSVRDIYFNVPARRKFLGSDAKQLLAIRNEFVQQALAHPTLRFTLNHQGECLLNLQPGNLRQRIAAIFGDTLSRRLYPIDVQTEFVNISGFIADPQAARKRSSEQYFFANGRFIRHPYLRKAVTSVYETLTEEGLQVPYFLFLDVPADTVDVNVSPTKTEVKFENESVIWPILNAAVKECLGKFNAVPSIDFDQEGAPRIDVLPRTSPAPSQPKVQFDSNYNPFSQSEKDFPDFRAKDVSPYSGYGQPKKQDFDKPKVDGWENLFESYSHPDRNAEGSSDDLAAEPIIPCPDKAFQGPMLQFAKRYLVMAADDRLLLVDQHRARVRILFEQYMRQMESHRSLSQTLLFPESLDLGPQSLLSFQQIRPSLEDLGFAFETDTEDGRNVSVSAIPESLIGHDAVQSVISLLDASEEDVGLFETKLNQRLALKLAQTAATPYGQALNREEMEEIWKELCDCQVQTYTPDGKPVILSWQAEDISKKF